jgi:hypothetical protein
LLLLSFVIFKRFTTPDPVFGFRGGVEYGFLSATTSRSVALQYGEGGYLISLTTSLASRGASLKPFSYYPEEDVSLPLCIVAYTITTNKHSTKSSSQQCKN